MEIDDHINAHPRFPSFAPYNEPHHMAIFCAVVQGICANARYFEHDPRALYNKAKYLTNGVIDLMNIEAEERNKSAKPKRTKKKNKKDETDI